ncbi:MAG: HAD-IB family hydrolase [Burkholderiales bacterium]|nr:HAD-IB family hydrolase [Burkholderiales bacterium]
MTAAPPNPLKPRLTLFDLDHTLLEGDSDVLWCEFLMQRGVLERAAFAPRNAAMERDYRAGTVSTQAFSGFYVSTLAGRTADEWEPLRRAFLHDVVAPRIGRAARELVAARRRDSAIVVLTTATNRVITELTAEHLGIGHLIATECERDTAGRFTGRASGTLNMREGKVARLHEWLAERGELLADYDSWAYSDSMNDLPLLEAADHAVVVHADERLARLATERGWPSLRLHGPDVDE